MLSHGSSQMVFISALQFLLQSAEKDKNSKATRHAVGHSEFFFFLQTPPGGMLIKPLNFEFSRIIKD